MTGENQVPPHRHALGDSGASSIPIDGGTIVARSPSVLASESDGEVVIMSIEQGQYFQLNDVGSEIWRRIDPPCSLATLVSALAADYDANVATIAAQVELFVRRMALQDIVRLA